MYFSKKFLIQIKQFKVKNKKICIFTLFVSVLILICLGLVIYRKFSSRPRSVSIQEMNSQIMGDHIEIYGPELINNPSFETPGTDGNLLKYWHTSPKFNDIGTSKIELVTDSTYVGLQAGKLTRGNRFTTFHQFLALEPDAVYQLSFWTHGDGRFAGRYYVRDVIHNQMIIPLTSTNFKSTNYQELVTEFTVPQGATSIQIALVDPGAGSAYFDQVSVKKKLESPKQKTLIEHYQSYPVNWHGINPSKDGNDYLYGRIPWSGKVYRQQVNGQKLTERGSITQINSDYLVHNVLTTSTPDLIFVVATKTSSINEHYLLRSTDGGLSFTQVMTFGEGNDRDGADSKNIRLLTTENFLEITHPYPNGGGIGDLYIGEYSVAHSLIRGSYNDRVRLMRSTDQGKTWSAVMTWNTSGHQIRHIHTLKQDPYSGHVYICTGDGDIESSIIKWDGQSPWQNNLFPAQISQLPGFQVAYGTQHHRTVGLIITKDYIFTGADNDARNPKYREDSGIWRWSKDLSTGERVNSDIIDYDPMHVIWTGKKINEDILVFRTARQAAPGYPYTKADSLIYVSVDQGQTWHRAGLEKFEPDPEKDNITVPAATFTYNNHLFIDNLMGMDFDATDELVIIPQVPNNNQAIVVHPVYYVGNWNTFGQPQNNGRSPDTPVDTIENLKSKGISPEARIKTREAPLLHPAT